MKSRSRTFHLAVVVFLAAAPYAHAGNAPLPRSTPEAQGVSSEAIGAFIEAVDKIDTLHSFIVVRHGRVIAEAWWKPEAADKPHVLHSLSKSFNATAVGLAIEEGKLSLDDPVVKFFPADAPADASENLKAMTVRDLLTMTCGHDTEPQTVGGSPSVKQFLAHPVVHKPGTHFQYNTMGSYTLSAIVTKVTGKTSLEFLKPRLFEPLGIENPEWAASREGNSLGGSGLKICTEDIAKFGQLYLQKGKWNGKQLIPEKWVEQATSKQVPNDQESHAGIGVDWRQGYGFQFWRCTHGAFRGDGAAGQFCVVIPDKDAVIAITADTGNMQGELNAIWERLFPAFQAAALPEDAAGQEKVKQAVAKLVAHPAHSQPLWTTVRNDKALLTLSTWFTAQDVPQFSLRHCRSGQCRQLVQEVWRHESLPGGLREGALCGSEDSCRCKSQVHERGNRGPGRCHDEQVRERRRHQGMEGRPMLYEQGNPGRTAADFRIHRLDVRPDRHRRLVFHNLPVR